MSACRVTVHADRCSGIGLCEAIAPEVLEVGDDGRAHALGDVFDEALHGQIDEAVRTCPTQAITLDVVGRG